MPLLNHRSTEADLKCWIDYWSARYPHITDGPVLAIAAGHQGFLTVQDVVTVFEWKLEPRYRAKAVAAIAAFDAANPGELRRRTSSALAAKTDIEALSFLRGLPQMASIPSVAVASCLLMVLDRNRWTVIDRMANTALVALKKALLPIETRAGSLRDLYLALHNFNPEAPDYFARDLDWGIYLLICREIARITQRDLRTIDRALYMSRGDLYFECENSDAQNGREGEDASIRTSPKPNAGSRGTVVGVPISTSDSPCLCYRCFLEGLENWIAKERGGVKDSTRRTNRSDGTSFQLAYANGFVEGTQGICKVGPQECLSLDLFTEFWAARVATGAKDKGSYWRPVEGAFRHAPFCPHCEGRCSK